MDNSINNEILPINEYKGFVLGENISVHLGKKHTMEHFSPTFMSDTYHFIDDDIDVYCSTDGTIETISCSSSFLFNGIELIGLNINEFDEMVQQQEHCDFWPDEIIETDGVQQFYDRNDYLKLRLQLWYVDDIIKIVRVCSSFWSDD